MKYFFEAGVGSDSPSPGSDLGQTSGSDEDAGGEINGIRMSR